MDDNKFDDKLKARLGSMQFDPSPSFKAGLAAEFAAIAKQRRRKRFAIWFFSGTAIIGLLFSTSIYVLNIDSEPLFEKVQPVSKEIESNHRKSETGLSSNSAEASTSSPSEMDISSNSSIETNDPAEASTKSIIANTSSLLKEKDVLKGSQISNPSSNSTDRKTVQKAILNTATKNIDDADETNNDFAISSVKNLNFLSLENSRSDDRLALLPSLRFSLQNPNYNALEFRTLSPYSELRSPRTNSCARPFFLIGAGAGLSYRNLSSETQQDLVEHKNAHEKSTISYSGGISGSLPLHKSFAIKGGLQYLHLGESYYFEHGPAFHETVNTYNFLNLDVKLSRILICSEVFRVDISGGAKMGILTSAQSSWLDPSTFEPSAHSSLDDASPFAKYNLSWNAELAAYYTVRKNWFLGASIEADYFQTSVYVRETGLVQRPYFAQGSLVFGRFF